ncbi:GH92 family glycosyl hydrolase [Sporolactobacillus vineae]|uniref:GH92 family glycosyl hydrolase n=1 Tax=Sporolactobacillus vineae TaxID=444463 RepID=UPI000289A6C3|nr:GH92 family glycosyl hydrolase [Sporolactobacillus vineae]
MQNKVISKVLAGIIGFSLMFPALPGPAVPSAAAASSNPAFFTSFEKNDPAPDWKNAAESGNDGQPMIKDVHSTISGNSKEIMTTSVVQGPSSVSGSPAKAGWSGHRVLAYSGRNSGSRDSYAYNKLFRVRIPIKKNTQLSYYLAPVTVTGKTVSNASAYVSVDLAFSDGTYLHQLSQATDSDGIRMTPTAQGASGSLIANQWNYKTLSLGHAAAGKTIVRILIAYSDPGSADAFKGYLDDLRIGTADKSVGSSPVNNVNILTGTNSDSKLPRGETVPAVGVPNGFAYWSPALDSSSASHFYPYRSNNDPENLPEIQSFSLSHSPNQQNGERQSLQIMPSDFYGTPSASRLNRGLAFDRKNEQARPDRYSVTFNNGMKTELTALSHSAMLRFTFKGTVGNLIFDNLDNNGSITLNPSARTIQGYSDVKSETTGNSSRLFFYGVVDRPVMGSGRTYGQSRDNVTAYYKFDTSVQKTVTLRLSTSLIGIRQAKKNLDQEIGGRASFGKIAGKAARAWNSRLAKVSIPGATQTQRTTLYSALYRLFLYPNAGFENTGSAKKPEYRYALLDSPLQDKNGASRTGAPVKKGKAYVNSNFAYSAQTVWPAYALLEPGLTGQMINGFLDNKRNGGSAVPANASTYADTAFANAAIKGVPGIHKNVLYNALLTDSLVSGSPETGSTLEQLLAGYVRDGAVGNLGAALNDPTGSAKVLQDSSDYLLQRAQNYLTWFDTSANLFNEKTADGNWQQNTDVTGPSRDNPQASPDRWSLSFNVPQDGQGLANLYGGRSGLGNKLNQYFASESLAASVKKDPDAALAAAGRLGIFAINRPSAPVIPYMYLYAGEAAKTQDLVRTILNRFYTGSEIGQGYLGSDAGSMMSGYYFLAASGLFPLNQGSSSYVLSAPYFKKMIIHLGKGHDLTINAPAVSNTNRYIQSVTFNGRTVAGISISQQQLAGGGTLTFQMGAKPSDWGTSSGALPDSLTPLSTDGSTLYPKALANLADPNTVGAKLTASDKTNAAPLTAAIPSVAIFTDKHPSISSDFGKTPQRVKTYTLTSSADRGYSYPRSWTLFASDNGKKWDTIDHRSGETFIRPSMTRAFTIRNPAVYRYYRLKITERNSKYPLALNGYQLLGYTGIKSGYEVLMKELFSQFGKGNLPESEMASLSSALNRAQNAYNKADTASSIYYLQTFVQRLNASATGRARSILSADAQALVNLLAD